MEKSCRRSDSRITLRPTISCGGSSNRPILFSNIGAIFHLGACSSTTETDAAYLIRNNYEYTKKLAHFALEGGRRFVYASSAATYGALEASLPEAVALESLRPLNMYGYSKHLFDCYAARAGMLPRITGVKYFNVFGPNEYHKGDMRSRGSQSVSSDPRKGSVSLFKSYRPEFPDGGQRRDFLYVKDAVAATIISGRTCRRRRAVQHRFGGTEHMVISGERDFRRAWPRSESGIHRNARKIFGINTNTSRARTSISCVRQDLLRK